LSRSTPCLLLSYPCITGSINAAAYKGNLFFDPSTCKSFAFLRPHLRDFPYLTLTWSRWNFSFIMVWLTQKWSWFWDPLQGLAPRGPLSLGTNQDGEVSERSVLIILRRLGALQPSGFHEWHVSNFS
jgi:hypothetical protein